MVEGMAVVMNVMLSLMSEMSSPPALCRDTLCGCGGCCDCDACAVVCVACVSAERV